MRAYDIITVGTATRDIFLHSAAFRVAKGSQRGTEREIRIPLGSKIDIPSLVVSSGGGATNAAAAFALLGFRTAFLGRVGADDDGLAVLHDLHAHGIDTRYVRRDPAHATAISVLLSTARTGRTVLVYRGAAGAARRTDLPLRRIAARWLYVTSLGGDLPLLEWILCNARDRKIPVFVNPGASEVQKRKKARAVLRHASILHVNREEAHAFVGGARDDILSILRKLRRLCPGVLIVTDETRGAWALAQGVCYHSGIHKRIRIVERTGAGDAFGSGFLAGFLRSHGDVARAMQIATANAESVMGIVGAKNGLLRRFPPAKDCVAVRRVKIF